MPGGGRPKGSLNKRTYLTVEHYRENFDVLPLDYLLGILNDSRATKSRKFDAARAAAPYLHSRLSSTELTGKGGGPVQWGIDLSKLNDEELSVLERLMAKGGAPAPANDDSADNKKAESA